MMNCDWVRDAPVRSNPQALAQGWLQVRETSRVSAPSVSELVLVLDLGEAEAILLAEEVECRFLLIDERKGRCCQTPGYTRCGRSGCLVDGKEAWPHRFGSARFEESGTGWLSSVGRVGPRNRSACGGGWLEEV